MAESRNAIVSSANDRNDIVSSLSEKPAPGRSIAKLEGLLQRGYSEEDIRKILGENVLRVWAEVERYAATTSSST